MIELLRYLTVSFPSYMTQTGNKNAEQVIWQIYLIFDTFIHCDNLAIPREII